MKKGKFLRFLSEPKYISWIYILVSVITALTKALKTPSGINNYLIFKNVFFNTLKQRNLYLKYPSEYQDINHYGVFFSAIIAPFAIMPDLLGVVLWNIANTIVFVYAARNLPFSEKTAVSLGIVLKRGKCSEMPFILIIKSVATDICIRNLPN